MIRSTVKLPMAVAFVIAALGCGPSHAATFRIATWNLGWHVSTSELSPWIAQCSRVYAKSPDGVWRLAPPGTPSAKRGWEVTEARAVLEGVDLSLMPPCNVYATPSFQPIEVTFNAYRTRTADLARFLRESVRADVIAFQEVSGTDAVREALGSAAADYYVCSFDGAYKVQRLAFAWKKSLGRALDACTVSRALSLPGLPADLQVRPGYAVVLKLGGKRIRFMTVHLKSGCVSPLAGNRLDGDTGPDDPCPTLQRQVGPLEAELEHLAEDVDGFVLLGDFNRNLWHEQNLVAGAEAVRSDGSTDLAAARTAGVATRNLLREIADGAPPESAALLLSAACPGGSDVAAACEASKTVQLTAQQRSVLAAPSGLGCRNAVGLDQVLVSRGLAENVRAVRKVVLGNRGRSLGPQPPRYPEPLLALSDHCPTLFELEL